MTCGKKCRLRRRGRQKQQRRGADLPAAREMGHVYAETTLQYVNLSMVDVAAEFHRAAEEHERR